MVARWKSLPPTSQVYLRGSKVTKEILLGSTESPADYLLSYIKLFNLRFIKDVGTKTVTITPNYFNGNIIDIEERIDRGQAVNITPNVFSKKFMRLGLNQPETYFAKKVQGDEQTRLEARRYRLRIQ